MSRRTLIGLCLASVGFKLLLVPSYRSTDFEVHRNWLAVTHSLPLREWYFEATSEWTLDYPPFFAYFEWLLSHIAPFFDQRMVQVSREAYSSPATVLFQRGSVIVTEALVLHTSAWYYLEKSPCSKVNKLMLLALVVFNGGLLLVDHIHFQYNGLVIGMLVLCLALARDERPVAVAVAFSVLVLTKHLFLTLAPLFALYLLQVYCSSSSSDNGGKTSRRVLSIPRFSLLVFIAAACVFAALGPFCLSQASSTTTCQQQLAQIASRLFPFGRGLVHAYWAPNIWALYYALDGCLLAAGRRLGVGNLGHLSSATTRGLVGNHPPAILPSISPAISMLLVLTSQVPALLALFRRPHHPGMLARCTVYVSFCAFMFGWHVHEKAILVPWIIQTLVLAETGEEEVAKGKDATYRRRVHLFLLTSVAGIYCLFPLLENLIELPVKASIALCFVLGAWTVCALPPKSTLWGSSQFPFQNPILSTFVLFFLAAEFVHPLVWGSRIMPFLPLMATSTLCAVVLIYCWGLSLLQVLDCQPQVDTKVATRSLNRSSRLTRHLAVTLFFFVCCFCQQGEGAKVLGATAAKKGLLTQAYDRILSDSRLLEFSRNGHVYLPGMLSPSSVTAMATVMKKEFRERKKEAEEHALKMATGAPPFFQLFNTWKRNDFAKPFILHRQLGWIAAQLLDVPSVRLYQDALFVKEPKCGPTEWHSDLRMSPFCSNDLVTFWIPLTAVASQEEGGTGLSYASRSHTDFSLPFWFNVDELDLSDRYVIDDHGAHALGDVSAHHGWTLHAAPPNLSRSTRLALSLSYVADGAPMLPTNVQGKFELGGESGLLRLPDEEDSPSYASWVGGAGPFLTSDSDAACPLVFESDEGEG